MKVSFVIPTRNQAPFIRRCIDGCLAQNIAESEIRVLDAVSTDGTQEILASYGARIVWRSEKDGGQSDAVNQGVAQSSGEIIAWINSDDCYAAPDVVARVLRHFDADPELDIVYGDGLMIDVEGRPIRPYRARTLHSPKELVIHPSSPLLQPAAFFRRRLFNDVGGLDRALHFTLDYDLWIRMWGRAHKTRYLPETLAHATYHAGAKSIHGMRKQIDECVALKLRYGRALGFGAVDWALTIAGVARLYAYWAATKSGLYRAS